MSDSTTGHIRPRERDAILQSLRAGVVPRAGHQHIQVGRINELNVMVNDIGRVADGGSTIRFIIGEYGSGKSFFMGMIAVQVVQIRELLDEAKANTDRGLSLISWLANAEINARDLVRPAKGKRG